MIAAGHGEQSACTRSISPAQGLAGLGPRALDFPTANLGHLL